MRDADSRDGSEPRWHFVLYKAGDKPTMKRAERGLRRLCEHYLKDNYSLVIIDVLNDNVEVPPDILAVPTAIRTSPGPERRIIGDLSQVSKAAEWLGLSEAGLNDDLQNTEGKSGGSGNLVT